MLTTSVYIYQPIDAGGHYECQLYMTENQSYLQVGDVLIDTNSNEYSIFGFYNPSNPSQDETNSLFQDGWQIELNFITSDVIPLEDTGYNSTVESPSIPDYLPDVSWGTYPYDVVPDVPAYTYSCKLSVENSGDPGAGDVQVGYYLVDNEGNFYEVIQVIGASPIEVKLKDVNEIDNNTPNTNLGYVYQTKNDADIISQAQYYRMSQVARDKTINIEKGILWGNRGLLVNDGTTDFSGVTKMSASLFTITEGTDGWNGGKEINIEPQPASETQAGIVTTGDQTFSGNKNFTGNVVFEAAATGNFDGGTF